MASLFSLLPRPQTVPTTWYTIRTKKYCCLNYCIIIKSTFITKWEHLHYSYPPNLLLLIYEILSAMRCNIYLEQWKQNIFLVFRILLSPWICLHDSTHICLVFSLLSTVQLSGFVRRDVYPAVRWNTVHDWHAYRSCFVAYYSLLPYCVIFIMSAISSILSSLSWAVPMPGTSKSFPALLFRPQCPPRPPHQLSPI